ncbi:MAG: hypothetical protein M3092_02780 [Actinomycetia bacterium]|nr:hypothetical protein [Actinomycetes bacterium]
MRRLGALLLLGALTVALLPAAPALAKNPLQAETEYTLDLTNTVVDGYLLAWVGTIDGDIEGCIEWWIELATWTNITKPDSPAQAGHYTMKTLIYDECGGTLILETRESGTTTMANTSWRTNGVVTYADPILFPDWDGRRVHEGGRFSVDVFPWEGTSAFRLN